LIYTKEELLEDLREHTYVMLSPSSVEGIGVFAIHRIPKGCREMFPNKKIEWVKLTEAEVESLPEHSRYMVQRYWVNYEGFYYVPDSGLKFMPAVCFLNHSENPNIVCINDGECWEAVRDIEVGEELFINYESLDDRPRTGQSFEDVYHPLDET
jgi:SET domain-containing protein